VAVFPAVVTSPASLPPLPAIPAPGAVLVVVPALSRARLVRREAFLLWTTGARLDRLEAGLMLLARALLLEAAVAAATVFIVVPLLSRALEPLPLLPWTTGAQLGGR